MQVNQILCEEPLPIKEIDSIWKQSVKYIVNGTTDGKSDKESFDKMEKKNKYTVFKYTSSNKDLYESVLIGGKPFFITFGEEVKIVDEIVQDTRILKPPHAEEYPYKPIAFENKDEIDRFVKMIKDQHVSIDLLFCKIREYISKFIVHSDHILDYISSLILFSYFQDKFPTVPYTMFVSDNGRGKSTIGNVFEVLGYRTVNMTDPTTANIFRIFGTIESGQCSLVLDEAEKIDKDKDMMSILKTGYENGKRVQRVNPYTNKPDHYHTYGLKIMLAERTPNPSAAKGTLDRIFIISNYKGKPELDIKEIKNPTNTKQIKISRELEFLRKSLMIYRLIHFKDEIVDIETGLDGREKELCKPLLQLFYRTKSQQKIEKPLKILLDEKNDRKANSLERDILEVVVDLFNVYPNGQIPFYLIWTTLKDKTNGHSNQFKENELETEIHGTI